MKTDVISEEIYERVRSFLKEFAEENLSKEDDLQTVDNFLISLEEPLFEEISNIIEELFEEDDDYEND